jgi:hypothetical protein
VSIQNSAVGVSSFLKISWVDAAEETNTKIIGNKGQGVLPVPNVYNGWVQELPIAYKAQLTKAQRNPIGSLPGRNPHDDHDDDHDDDK